MCRWVAYKGQPVFLEHYVTTADHSLIHQSLHAEKGKTVTNGDGFGIGWYGARDNPGLYREILPAWNDTNLKSLASQIQSSLFFAHVRASTGTATNRCNCHPFAYDKWLFMHNGQIGDYHKVRRWLEAQLSDGYYEHRFGSTDFRAAILACCSGKFAGMPGHSHAQRAPKGTKGHGRQGHPHTSTLHFMPVRWQAPLWLPLLDRPSRPFALLSAL